MLGDETSVDLGCVSCFFFFNDTATTEIYTLSLHDALPIWITSVAWMSTCCGMVSPRACAVFRLMTKSNSRRSEEHTSELQSRQYLVCRLLLEKKKPPSAHRLITPRSVAAFTHHLYQTDLVD